MVEVIFLKQFYRTNGFTYETVSRESGKSIIEAQLSIADYLIKNSELPIVVEGQYEDIDCNNYSDLCRIVKEFIFPEGLPSKYAQLYNIQKKFIYDMGAVKTLLYLGLVPKLYSSIDKVSSNLIDLEASKGDYNKVFSYKEAQAIKYVERAANLNYGNDAQGKVILVFAAKYSFRKECEEYGYNYTELNVMREIINKNFPSIEENNYGELSEKLKLLLKSQPSATKKFLNSEYVHIEEFEKIVEEDFDKLEKIFLKYGLVEFVSNGALPISQLFAIDDNINLTRHFFGPVREGLLSLEISFEQLLKLSDRDLDSINSFRTIEDLKAFLRSTDIQTKVKDLDISVCIEIDSIIKESYASVCSNYLYEFCREDFLCGIILDIFE